MWYTLFNNYKCAEDYYVGVLDPECMIQVIKIKPPKSNRKGENGPVQNYLQNIDMDKYMKELNGQKISLGTKISNILFSKNDKI